MWLSTQTRPDISNAVRAAARCCAAPKRVDWRAALGILRYVRRTRSFGITSQRGSVGALRSHAGMFLLLCVFVHYSNKIFHEMFFSAEAIIFPAYTL